MSSLSEPFIRRPAMTTLLTVSVVLFGVVAYNSLPVNDLPAVDYPVIQVSVNYPGASPTTIASNIATPLERQFMQIPGLELVTSQSTQGRCALTLQFALSKSIDAAATDVQTAITQSTGSLPVDLPSPPTFSKTNPNDQPIMYVGLSSNSITAGKLYDICNTIVAQQVSLVPGVSRVDVFGTKSAVRVKADPDKLAARGISMDDLAKAVGGGTAYQAAGQFDGPNKTFLLQPRGQLESATEYANQIIAIKDGAPVYLRDVAEVKESVVDERLNMHFWVNGVDKMPSATAVVAVNRQAGTNAVEIATKVRGLFPIISLQLPKSITVTPIYDRSIGIINSAIDVEVTLLIAFVLVVAVIFLFLGRVTDTLIPVVALPLSLLMTAGAMSLLGYSLDNLSLMALTLAIGFLVDDAIVFLENTVRRMEMGETRMTATLNSAKEINFTILSMTLSLGAVFLPLVFMPGLIGRIFREFAVTIIVSIIASGLVSLTLTPLMCSRMLSKRGHNEKKTLMERFANAIINPIIRMYGRTLTWALRFHLLSLIVWIACFVGTAYFIVTLPKSFLPVGDSSFILGVQVGREGSSPKQLLESQNQADTILQKTKGVEAMFTMSSNGQFLAANQSLVLAFLTPPGTRPPIQIMAGQLMGSLSTIPNTMTFLSAKPVLEISTGASGKLQGQLQYSISGVVPEEVYEASGKLMAKLSQFDGFASMLPDLNNHTPNLDIEILRDQASAYGVSVARIETLLRQAYSQNYLYLIKKADDQYQVILEAADDTRANPEDITSLYVASDDGKRQIPLSALTKWKRTIGLQSVNHLNQFTSVTLSFNLKPGVPIGNATAFINKAAEETLPPTVRGTLRGEALDFQNTVFYFVILLALAVFVMYVILGILYESYLHPVTVLSSLPVALVGGLWALYATGETLSLYAGIGLFMLMGIVKKNGIMMVDFALQRQAEGKTAREAIHDASVDRFRPIIMTTLAALMGAIPIAVGYGADGESRKPLGMVIVGGMIVSQVVTLYVTPVIYLYLEWLQENVLDRFDFFRSHRIVPTVPEVVAGE